MAGGQGITPLPEDVQVASDAAAWLMVEATKRMPLDAIWNVRLTPADGGFGAVVRLSAFWAREAWSEGHQGKSKIHSFSLAVDHFHRPAALQEKARIAAIQVSRALREEWKAW